MAKKTGKKKPVEEEIPIKVVDEESASNSSDNTLQLIVSLSGVIADLTVDEFISLQHGYIEPSKKILSRYVGDGNGRLLNPVDAEKLLGKLKLMDLTALILRFFNQMNEVVVPKANGSDSQST